MSLSELTPIYKVLVSQARVNSRLISVIMTLAQHSDPKDDRNDLIESLKGVMHDNQEFMDSLKAAVNKLEEEMNG